MSLHHHLLPRSLVLIGAGHMGGALLRGWLNGPVPAGNVTVIDPAPSEAVQALRKVHRFVLNPPEGDRSPPEVLVLAVKPQALGDATAELAHLAGRETLVISVLAGKTVANIHAHAPRATRIIRAMPNTPAAIGRGITGLFAANACSEDDKALAAHLLGVVGAVEWVTEEQLIDAVTAVSGSGPAYVFLLAEALAEAGRAAGLPPETAARLARATVEGAGELLFRSPDMAPGDLRAAVTSPGGTTAAALSVLMAEDGLAALMTRAVAAAKARAGELAG